MFLTVVGVRALFGCLGGLILAAFAQMKWKGLDEYSRASVSRDRSSDYRSDLLGADLGAVAVADSRADQNGDPSHNHRCAGDHLYLCSGGTSASKRRLVPKASIASARARRQPPIVLDRTGKRQQQRKLAA